MMKRTHALVSIVLVLALILGSFSGGVILNKKGKKAEAAGDENLFVKSDGTIAVPRNDANAEVGTEGHPFMVLEIVPWDKQAFFGFQIAGCEPIDIEKMGFMGEALPDNGNFLTQSTAPMGYWEGQEGYEGWPTKKLNGQSLEKKDIPYAGVMTYVGSTGGEYELKTTRKIADQVLDPRTNEKVDAYEHIMEKKTDKSGQYDFVPVSVAEAIALKTGVQNYNDFTLNNYEYELPVPGSRSGKDFYYNFGENEHKAYYNESAYSYTHKNEFLKYAVGLAYDYKTEKYSNGTSKEVRYEVSDDIVEKRLADYKAVVYTVTPEDLNMNLGLIDRADMIVISTKNTYYGKELSDSLYKEELFGHADTTLAKRVNNKKDATFNNNPIDWPVVQKIYSRVTDFDHNCPLVVDSKTYSDISGTLQSLNGKSGEFKVKFSDGEVTLKMQKATENNMYKLLILCLQMQGSTFKTLFADNTGKVLDGSNFGTADTSLKNKDGSKIKTGTFKLYGNNVAAWNLELFYPYEVFKKSDLLANDNKSLDSTKVKNAVIPYGICTPYGGDYNWQSGRMQDAVRSNVYTYNGDTKMRENFYIEDKSKDINSWNATENDQYGHEVYDFLQSITSGAQAKPPKGVDVADIIYYILHYKSPNNPNGPLSGDLNVLEIEPYTNFTNKSEMERTAEILLASYANFTGNVNFYQITSSELNGKKLDILADFDFIYVGVNDPKKSGDITMPSGFKYAHSGAKVTINPGSSGDSRGLYGFLTGNFSKFEKNDNDDRVKKENQFIYSGNDITKLVRDNLLQLRDDNSININLTKEDGSVTGSTAYPVIFGEGTFSGSGVLSQSISSSIDRNTYLYDLFRFSGKEISTQRSFYVGNMKTMKPSDSNVTDVLNFYKTGLHALVKNALSHQVKLTDVVLPNIYSGMNSLDDKDGSGYLSGNTIQIKFTLDAQAGTTYEVKFYVDTNGDGIFNANECTNARVSDCINGYAVSRSNMSDYSVVGGKTYFVNRTVRDRNGSAFWKLEILKNGKVYAAEEGLSAIKVTDANKIEDLPILQILPDGKALNVALPTQNEVKAYYENKGLGLGGTLENTAKSFIKGVYSGWDYAKDKPKTKINGLLLLFDRMSADEILKKAGERCNPKKTNLDSVTADDVYAFFDSYKMLVSGFSDCFTISTNQSRQKVITDAILKFSEEGKAVLYTHDNTSFVSDGAGTPSESWNSQMTKSVRESFGMDRYSVMSKKGSGSSDGRQDLPYVTTGSNSDLKKIIKNTNDSSLMLAQGFTSAILYRLKDNTGNLTTKKVQVINKAAITDYPYKIKDQISVASTHNQYYQLDMESPNINVWYTLDKSGAENDPGKKYYDWTDRDVRNNYYIYNIDNVTYTGVGHSAGLTNDEVMLFINTFVAAYRAAAVPARAIVTNDDVVARDDSFFLCVDVDSSQASKMIGNDIYDNYDTVKTLTLDDATNKATYAKDTTVNEASKRVYFRIEDDTLLLDTAYYKLDFTVDGKPINLAVYKQGSDKSTEKCDANLIKNSADLKRDVFYFVDVPITTETTNGETAISNTELGIVTKVRYASNSGKGQSIKTSPETKVTIMPRGLFNLD